LWPFPPFVQALTLYFLALLLSLVVAPALCSLLACGENSVWGHLNCDAKAFAVYPESPMGWGQRSEGEMTGLAAD